MINVNLTCEKLMACYRENNQDHTKLDCTCSNYIKGSPRMNFSLKIEVAGYGECWLVHNAKGLPENVCYHGLSDCDQYMVFEDYLLNENTSEFYVIKVRD